MRTGLPVVFVILSFKIFKCSPPKWRRFLAKISVHVVVKKNLVVMYKKKQNGVLPKLNKQINKEKKMSRVFVAKKNCVEPFF